MKVDDCIIKLYLADKPYSEYSDHWVYHEVQKDKYLFEKPSPSRSVEVEDCYKQIIEICKSFVFRNNDLVCHVFDGVPVIIEHATVLFTVGLPGLYDALVLEHEGLAYIIIDLIHFANYIKNGRGLVELINNFLTHELIHVLINTKYPRENFSYTEYLEFIAFHEGFAHLLSFKENIEQYQLDNTLKDHFHTAKTRLIDAINEKDPTLQKKYTYDANGGKYWDKFASVASMLYLMKHISTLKEIYENGWKGYTQLITNYSWQ